jgi:hypothetical protein
MDIPNLQEKLLKKVQELKENPKEKPSAQTKEDVKQYIEGPEDLHQKAEAVSTMKKPKVATTSGRTIDPEMKNNFMNYFLKKPQFVLTCGSSNSGKTYAMKSLLSTLIFKYKHFKRGFVFQGSKGLNDDWDWIPDQWQFDGYKDSQLNAICEILKKQKESLPEGQKLPATFIVFDDLLGILSNSKFFKHFLSIYRHYNISIFLNTQQLKNGITIIREQTTIALLFDTDQQIKTYYDCFGTRFSDNKNEFIEEFRKIADPKKHVGMLVIAGVPKEHNYLRYTAPPDFKPYPVKFSPNDTHGGRGVGGVDKKDSKLSQLKKAMEDDDSDDD